MNNQENIQDQFEQLLPNFIDSDSEDKLRIEIQLFDRGKNIIESCTNISQLKVAEKYIELIRNRSIGVYSALIFVLLAKTHNIELEDSKNEKH